MAFNFGGSGGDTEFTFKRIVWALLIISILPIMITVMVSPAGEPDEWEEEYNSITAQIGRASCRERV